MKHFLALALLISIPAVASDDYDDRFKIPKPPDPPPPGDVTTEVTTGDVNVETSTSTGPTQVSSR